MRGAFPSLLLQASRLSRRARAINYGGRGQCFETQERSGEGKGGTSKYVPHGSDGRLFQKGAFPFRMGAG